jgi:flagellar protein FlgJ
MNTNSPLSSNLMLQKTLETGLQQNSGSDDNEALAKVADQFEAIFIENLLKHARSSKLSDGLFDTDADDNFVEMFDKELANSSSKMVDIGIAEASIRQMTISKSGDGS